MESMRDRLRRYYAYYAPTKTEADVETALETFGDGKKGGYEAMFAKLEAKYGPEKSMPESASISLSDEEKQVASKLSLFYKHYGVPKTDTDVKTALMKFRNGANGGFQKMFDKLVEKYGPIPDSVAKSGSSSNINIQQHQPSSSVNQQQQPQQDLEQQMMVQREAPRDKFDPALEDPAAKLRRFYDCHAPTKTDDEVHQSLSKFIGPGAAAAGGEKALWVKLADKYGAMPLPPPGYTQQWSRLRKFFNHYNVPATKNSEIDWMLAKANSTPTGLPQLWQSLIAKFGPEPLDPEIERAMKGPFFISSRYIGDGAPPPSLSMNASMPRAHGELFRRPKPKESAGLGECVRLIINFAGIDYAMLEEMPLDRRRMVADAMEQQVAINAGLQVRNVALIEYRGSDAEFELSSTPGTEAHLFHAAASLVPRTQQGCFSVKHLREVLLKECKLNPLHVHATAARIAKASSALASHHPHSTRPPIVDAEATLREAANFPPDAPQLRISEAEARRIKIADEVEKMSEQQRFQYSWKKSLEERLAGGRGSSSSSSSLGGSNAASSLSYKRNNEAFREFMGNIWSETAAAFSKEGARSQSRVSNSNNNTSNNNNNNNDNSVSGGDHQQRQLKNPIPSR